MTGSIWLNRANDLIIWYEKEKVDSWIDSRGVHPLAFKYDHPLHQVSYGVDINCFGTEIQVSDLPLYISWEVKTEMFADLMKGK